MHILALAQPCPRGWRNPRDLTAPGYMELDFWTSLAKTCERGLFDGLFLADIMGPYDGYQGSWKPAVRHAVQNPHDDPALIVSAMAAATRDLGFGVTWNTSVHAPYYTAKVFSTLDHLTRGRIGWNIVTGYVKNAERNGLGELLPHDERYEQAEEYMQVVYKLWEHSWEDGAVIRDRESGVHTLTERVHEIRHEGPYFSVEGPHICEPSAQRTPLLLQAGGSPRGLAFGGKHGEVLFTVNPTPEKARESTAKARAAAESAGRDRSDVKVLAGVCVIVGEDAAEAHRKHEEARSTISLDAAFALFGGWTGVDLSKYDLDDPLEILETDGMKGLLDNFRTVDAGRKWRIRDLADWLKGGTMAPDIVGSPTEVVDELEHWMKVGEIDGFMLQPYTTPGSHEDFVDLVVPELQRRGLYRTSYEASTFREHTFGAGNNLLAKGHPAHQMTIGG